MNIPSFLLAKLYTKGTLKNTDSGFEFSLRNLIDTTALSAIGPIAAGGRSYGNESISLVVEDKTWEGRELSALNPATLPVGLSLRILVKGERLGGGTQKLSVMATSIDIGAIKFDIIDVIG